MKPPGEARALSRPQQATPTPVRFWGVGGVGQGATFGCTGSRVAPTLLGVHPGELLLGVHAGVAGD